MGPLHTVLTLLQLWGKSWEIKLHRFLFFLGISLSCLAFFCNGVCEVFSCGDYTLDFPFGTYGSGCGDPALQLVCDNAAEKPLITIGDYQYYLLDPHNYSSINPYSWNIVILYKQFEKDACDFSESVYDQFWSAKHFHILGDYANVTLGKSCSTDGSYGPVLSDLMCNEHQYFNGSLPDLSSSCKSNFKIVMNKTELDSGKSLSHIIDEGINIEWSASKECPHCETDHINCTHLTNSSFCYCDAMSYSQCSTAFTEKSSKKAITLGAAIGGSVLLTATVLFVGFCRKRSSAAKESQLRMMAMEPSLTTVEKFLDDYAHEMPTRYSYSQLKKITNNFADKLGEGGFGVVYKGRLARGNLVAVKILDQSRHSETQFINEVATIGRIHHVHLVRLMVYCFDGFRSALVYEYMVNGSLEKFIFAGDKKERILNAEELYSIALGTARGIAYLHQDCQRRIIHFDIKPHNILLDKDFTPKIADFGLAKLYGRGDDHISMTAARGTPGYAAPEIWNRNLGSVTDKSDVYSFGMVLLEMAGGRKNIELQVSRSSQLYFPEWAFKMMEKGGLERGLRRNGEAKCEEMEKAVRLAKVGLRCIQYNSRDRPSMSRVVQMLEGNGDDVSNPPLPFNSAPAFQGEEFSSTV